MDFPALDEKTIWNVAAVFRLLAENPGMLDHPACPYSEDVKGWLRRQLHRSDEPASGDADLTDLESEARELFQQMKDLKLDISGQGVELKEKIAYLKVGTQLLEKLLVIQERASDVKAYAKFQKNVIRVLEEVVTPEQRTEIMDRLNAVT